VETARERLGLRPHDDKPNDEPKVEVETDPVDPGPPAESRPLDPAAARMAAMRAFRA
jgi:hypothetical protein